MRPKACVVAGTAIAAAAGYVAIETLKPGDLVWAWDEETGDVALKPVKQLFVNESDELIHLTVNGEEITTTPTHPFYVAHKGWYAAVDLRAGDILVLVNGEYVTLEKTQHEILEAPITVYNFEVEDYHTYYVGTDGVLVHNTCTNKNTKTEWDIQKYSKGQVKANYKGTRITAQYDGKYYWTKDFSKHGGSAFKVFTKHKNKLYWYRDADKYGNFIVGKHKSNVGMILSIG